MKTFMVRAKELADSCRRVKNNNVYETLSKEFNISKRLAGDRFKSIFKMCVRDYISKNITPNKEFLIDCLIKSENFNEFYKLTDFNNTKELYLLLEKYFNQSNYFKIKTNLIAKIPIHNYFVNREDNESILLSQYFGDGHIERFNSFKIEHCENQYEYLKFKIGLLNKAFPMTNGIEGIKPRTFILSKNNKEYKSYSYRTNGCLGKQILKILNRSLSENVKNITPFGICLYYLDDGYLTYNANFNTIELGISSKNDELRLELIKYFKTFGFQFNNSNKSAITLQSKIAIIKFINEFIIPFDYLLPECIKYKYNYKDIVGVD